MRTSKSSAKGYRKLPTRPRHYAQAEGAIEDFKKVSPLAWTRSHIKLIPLPRKCPKLNPQENIWQFMRENWLSNRIFKPFDDVVGHCCDAWNRLVDQPWRIMSIGLDRQPGPDLSRCSAPGRGLSAPAEGFRPTRNGRRDVRFSKPRSEHVPLVGQPAERAKQALAFGFGLS